eukprot:gene5217-8829_t
MGQDQLGKKNQPKSPGITTVVSAENQTKDKDEILDILRNLPKAKPLIQGNLNLSNTLNFFNDKNKLRESLDEKIILELAARFQTEMMVKNEIITKRQNLVFKKFQDTKNETQKISEKIETRHIRLQNLNYSLRESENLQKSILLCTKSVEHVTNQIKHLKNLLPKDVIDQIDNPLFF